MPTQAAVRALHATAAHGLLALPEPTGASPVIDVRHVGSGEVPRLEILDQLINLNATVV